MIDLNDILQKATIDITSTDDLKALDDHRVHYLGKKSQLTECLKQLGQLSPEERPIVGQKINHVKQKVQELIENQSSVLQKKQVAQQLAAESIDITLPGRLNSVGSIHPVTKTQQRIEALFNQMGFSVMSGPEIEDDYHNFEALNIPPLHPARSMQDTFYVDGGSLLRTQTSNVQIRVMKDTPPPLRIISMGRVYRSEFDLTHTPMFHQIEGLMVDEQVHFADLKETLRQFLNAFFEKEIAVRFRPAYFPFTEPSAEVDIGCINCHAQGCRICKQTGWVEVLGCGMVHPNVFQSVGIDSERYTGWAFGAGLDRLTMLHYGITDLRSLFENDLRFLRQF
jgi:phenylalanyl-tRNA synthetase alpha chain